MDSITNSIDMSLSKFQKIVKDREAWHAVVHRVTSFFFNLCIYLFDLSYGMQDLHCIMQDLSLWRVGSVVVVCRLSCSIACGIFVPLPGFEPISPTLQGRFLTTGPPRKSILLGSLTNDDTNTCIIVTLLYFLQGQTFTHITQCKPCTCTTPTHNPIRNLVVMLIHSLRFSCHGDFPDGPVVNTLPFQCMGHRFHPWLGN